jgi:hypothetical protein
MYNATVPPQPMPGHCFVRPAAPTQAGYLHMQASNTAHTHTPIQPRRYRLEENRRIRGTSFHPPATPNSTAEPLQGHGERSVGRARDSSQSTGCTRGHAGDRRLARNNNGTAEPPRCFKVWAITLSVSVSNYPAQGEPRLYRMLALPLANSQREVSPTAHSKQGTDCSHSRHRGIYKSIQTTRRYVICLHVPQLTCVFQ